jgi:hypothetical protein
MENCIVRHGEDVSSMRFGSLRHKFFHRLTFCEV